MTINRNSVLLILLFVYAPLMFAQQQFQVEFHRQSGKLTSSDLYKKGFGRYDGYQLPVNKGEAVNLLIYSEKFTPTILLVDPEGKTFRQNSANAEGYAHIETVIPSTGEWIVYVVGDSMATGDYFFQYGFAEPNSIELDSNADFCTGIDFLLEHANAYFIFLENPVDLTARFPKLEGATDAFIDEDDGSYTATMYDGNNEKEAVDIYDNLLKKVKSCVKKGWKVEESDWKTVEEYREKYYMYKEQTASPRYVKVSLIDYGKASDEFLNKYNVVVIINKEQ